MAFTAFIIALSLLQVVDGNMILTTKVIEMEPETKQPTEIAIRERLDVMKFSDFIRRITVIMDTTLGACFVQEYDPFWNPNDEDKLYLLDMTPCVRYEEERFEELEQKIGLVIANKCQSLAIVHLNEPPLLMDNGSPPQLSGCQDPQVRAAIELRNAKITYAPIADPVSSKLPETLSSSPEVDTPPTVAPNRGDIGDGNNAIPPTIKGYGHFGSPLIDPTVAVPALKQDNIPPLDLDAIATPPSLEEYKRQSASEFVEESQNTKGSILREVISGRRFTATLAPPTPDMRTPPMPREVMEWLASNSSV